MKTLFLIITVLCFTTLLSQVSHNSDLNKFVGTWRWTSGNDTVSIVLEKQTINFPAGQSVEELVGWHRYVKNGIEIESSFPYIGQNYNSYIDSNISTTKVTLLGSTRNPQKVFFTMFRDLTLNKSCELHFTLLPNSLTQATWKLTDHQGVYNGPTGTINQFTLPHDLVFTKQ